MEYSYSTVYKKFSSADYTLGIYCGCKLQDMDARCQACEDMSTKILKGRFLKRPADVWCYVCGNKYALKKHGEGDNIFYHSGGSITCIHCIESDIELERKCRGIVDLSIKQVRFLKELVEKHRAQLTTSLDSFQNNESTIKQIEDQIDFTNQIYTSLSQ